MQGILNDCDGTFTIDLVRVERDLERSNTQADRINVRASQSSIYSAVRIRNIPYGCPDHDSIVIHVASSALQKNGSIRRMFLAVRS